MEMRSDPLWGFPSSELLVKHLQAHLLAPLEASGFKSWAFGGVALARNPLVSLLLAQLKAQSSPLGSPAPASTSLSSPSLQAPAPSHTKIDTC